MHLHLTSETDAQYLTILASDDCSFLYADPSGVNLLASYLTEQWPSLVTAPSSSYFRGLMK